jgi:sulfur relay (sulfurtransferase) complex TusBCD TusD component (DsrE family)
MSAMWVEGFISHEWEANWCPRCDSVRGVVNAAGYL